MPTVLLELYPYKCLLKMHYHFHPIMLSRNNYVYTIDYDVLRVERLSGTGLYCILFNLQKSAKRCPFQIIEYLYMLKFVWKDKVQSSYRRDYDTILSSDHINVILLVRCLVLPLTFVYFLQVKITKAYIYVLAEPSNLHKASMGSMALVPQVNKCQLSGSMLDASYYFCILTSSEKYKRLHIYSRETGQMV